MMRDLDREYPIEPQIRCPVCLDSYQEVVARDECNTMTSTVCGHLVCQQCLTKILTEGCDCDECDNMFGKCPTCRNVIDKCDSRPIYL